MKYDGEGGREGGREGEKKGICNSKKKAFICVFHAQCCCPQLLVLPSVIGVALSYWCCPHLLVLMLVLVKYVFSTFWEDAMILLQIIISHSSYGLE